MSISAIRAEAIERGAVAVVTQHLDRIAALDPGLHAFSVVLRESSLQAAAALDSARDRGESLGPLHGVPVAIKEEIDVAGCVTTFGGRANSTPAAADAEVVRRLRAAGAVIIGKTQMPEFGSFPFTEPEAYPATRNPWRPEFSPGGSSGGSAVAVATAMAAVAIGGDGGGSIRIPAACTGLFGLKPQRGRVSTAPNPHLWYSLGTCGPLARSAMDAAIVYDVIKGTTDTDMWRAPESGSFVEAAGTSPGRLRIGWSVKSPSVGLKPDRQQVQAVRETADLLRVLGHDVVEINPRYPDSTLPFIVQFLASIRFESNLMEHFDRLEKRTRQTYSLARIVTPARLDWALRASAAYSAKVNRIFEDIDVLLTPTMAMRPPKVGIITGKGTIASSLKSMPAIAYCALWNVAGNPAASVPVGVGDDGLPLAVQLVGRINDEPTLVSLAAQLEGERPFVSPPGY